MAVTLISQTGSPSAHTPRVFRGIGSVSSDPVRISVGVGRLWQQLPGRVEDAYSASGDERCTQASGILDVKGFNRPAKNVSLNLQPDRRARAAAATPKHSHLFVDFRDMRQA